MINQKETEDPKGSMVLAALMLVCALFTCSIVFLWLLLQAVMAVSGQ